MSLKKAPFGTSNAFDASPSVSFACTVWPRCIDCGLGADEQQVDLELAVADLRIDLRDLQPIGLAVDIGGRGLPDGDASEIEFVDVGLELVAAGAVDLADALALLKRLAELDVEAAELAGDRRPDVELAEAVAGDAHAAVERRGGRAQLAELARLQRLVLGDALRRMRRRLV